MRGVRYVSLAESSGYGVAGQAYLLALLHAGIPVQWSPLVATPHGYLPWTAVDGAREWITGLADERFEDGYFGHTIRQMLGAAVDHDIVILHCTPEHWPRHVEADKLNIGYTVWETDTPPPQWTGLVRSVDRVFVPSSFSKVVFENAAIDRPVDVIPHIRRPAAAAPSEAEITAFCSRHGIARQHCIFYAIEAWTARKALWKTIHAFLAAFTAEAPVSLVVKTSGEGPRSGAAADTTPTAALVRELVSHYPTPGNVVLINQPVSSAEIDLLHHIGDCYLSLTHSEGWGLGAFDAAAAGNPVVITGWGGHLDYLGADWPYLVDFDLTPVMDARGRHSYLPSQSWASPSMDHAVQLTREVYRNRDRASMRSHRLAARIDEELSEEAVGRQLRDALREAGRGAQR